MILPCHCPRKPVLIFAGNFKGKTILCATKIDCTQPILPRVTNDKAADALAASAALFILLTPLRGA